MSSLRPGTPDTGSFTDRPRLGTSEWTLVNDGEGMGPTQRMVMGSDGVYVPASEIPALKGPVEGTATGTGRYYLLDPATRGLGTPSTTGSAEAPPAAPGTLRYPQLDEAVLRSEINPVAQDPLVPQVQTAPSAQAGAGSLRMTGDDLFASLLDRPATLSAELDSEIFQSLLHKPFKPMDEPAGFTPTSTPSPTLKPTAPAVPGEAVPVSELSRLLELPVRSGSLTAPVVSPLVPTRSAGALGPVMWIDDTVDPPVFVRPDLSEAGRDERIADFSQLRPHEQERLLRVGLVDDQGRPRQLQTQPPQASTPPATSEDPVPSYRDTVLGSQSGSVTRDTVLRDLTPSQQANREAYAQDLRHVIDQVDADPLSVEETLRTLHSEWGQPFEVQWHTATLGEASLARARQELDELAAQYPEATRAEIAAHLAEESSDAKPVMRQDDDSGRTLRPHLDPQTLTAHVPTRVLVRGPNGTRALNLADPLEFAIAQRMANIQVEEITHGAGYSIVAGAYVPLGDIARLADFEAWSRTPAAQAVIDNLPDQDVNGFVHEVDFMDLHGNLGSTEVDRYPVRQLYQAYLETVSAAETPSALDTAQAVAAPQPVPSDPLVQAASGTGVEAVEPAAEGRWAALLRGAAVEPVENRWLALLRRADVVDETKGRFSTADAAAMAAMQRYNDKSVRNSVEYGGLIYKMLDGRFDFTPAVRGGSHNVKPWEAARMIPKGATEVGYYHTHPGVGGHMTSELFSPNDIAAARERSWPGMDYRAYLATPSGKYLVYEVDTHETVALQNGTSQVPLDVAIGRDLLIREKLAEEELLDREDFDSELDDENRISSYISGGQFGVDLLIDDKSKGIRLFNEMMAHYGKSNALERARSISMDEGESFGIYTNLDHFSLDEVNELTARGMPLEAAVMQSWLGKQAGKYGFNKPEILSFGGFEGNYSHVEISFDADTAPAAATVRTDVTPGTQGPIVPRGQRGAIDIAAWLNAGKNVFRTLLNLPGRYSSAEEAARAAAQRFFEISNERGLEYGGFIYRLPGSDTFDFTVNVGDADSINISQDGVPLRAHIVGDWHTHPGLPTPSFSAQDIAVYHLFARMAMGDDQQGYVGYLVNSQGIQSYSVKAQEVRLVDGTIRTVEGLDTLADRDVFHDDAQRLIEELRSVNFRLVEKGYHSINLAGVRALMKRPGPMEWESKSGLIYKLNPGRSSGFDITQSVPLTNLSLLRDALPAGAVEVGAFITRPRGLEGLENEYFFPPEIRGALRAAETQGLKDYRLYLRTPSGAYKVYSTGSGEVTTLKDGPISLLPDYEASLRAAPDSASSHPWEAALYQSLQNRARAFETHLDRVRGNHRFTDRDDVSKGG